ncbi:replication-relaxation family protein [Candidatus Bipolaricaulota bacterium]|nr:replication-relaxation family protein [Candidatus Bipolaricaulota bacterium]
MPKNNYRYFKRAKKENRPGLSITKRDRDILEAVAKYRYLSTSMFEAKFPAASERGLKRRLKKLFQHRLLNRPKSQVSLRVFTDQRELIYSLGPEGVKELVKSRDWERSRLSWQVKEVKSPYLAHGLAISRFRLTLELASKGAKERAKERQANWLHKYKHHRGAPDDDLKRLAIKKFYEMEKEEDGKIKGSMLNPDFDLTRWESGTYIQDQVVIGDRGEKEVAPIAPDGYFKLTLHQKKDVEKNFFLEMDRDTMTQERFLKKLKAYWNLKDNEAKDELKKELDIKSYRVVTVTNSERRKKNLLETSKQVNSEGESGQEDSDEEEDEKDKGGSDMFLFTCESNYSLKKPMTILRKIFETPGSEKKKSLLE